MNSARLMDLPPQQRQALQACVRAGQLRRGGSGYTGAEPGVPFSTRTVLALERGGYVVVTEGTTVVRPTEMGRALLGDLTGRKPEAVAPRQAVRA